MTKTFAGLIVLIALLTLGLQPQPITAAAPKVPRVMVALVFGQSNAANWGQGRRTAGANVQVFYKGRFYRASDPIKGADGEGGSVWTRLGDKLIAAKLYDKVIFVPVARGGSESLSSVSSLAIQNCRAVSFHVIDSRLRFFRARAKTAGTVCRSARDWPGLKRTTVLPFSALMKNAFIALT